MQLGKGGNDNVSIAKYGDVGLSFDNGHGAGAINAPWISWQPKLRAWITMDFVHLLCLRLFGLKSVQWVKGTSKVWFPCGFYSIVLFVHLLTSVPYSSSFVAWVVVIADMAVRKWDSYHDCEPWVGITIMVSLLTSLYLPYLGFETRF